METGYNLTASAAGRIGRMLRDYENGRLGRRPESDQDQIPGVGGVAFVIVTGTTAGYPAGEYDGTLSWFDAENNVWVSQFDPIRIRELNGGTLATGNKYQAEYLETIDGKEVFTVQASGGGGATGSTPLTAALLITSKGVGDFYNASSCLHTCASWECGAAGSLPIDLLAIDMNGLTLDIGRRYIGVHVGETGGKPIYGVQTWWGVVTNVWCDATGLHQTKREI